MSRKNGGNFPLIRRLTILLPLLCLASPVHSNGDGIPALLQFAEHYRNQQPETNETPPAGKSAQKTSRSSQPGPGTKHERLDYVGDTPIAKEAVGGVVVKESMTDGTVIQDMDLSGNMLSQPLSEYPPLFREAIGHLRNHGALTMVVPPSLAYGEAGYPPNATMAYTLRIENTEAASDK